MIAQGGGFASEAGWRTELVAQAWVGVIRWPASTLIFGADAIHHLLAGTSGEGLDRWDISG